MGYYVKDNIGFWSDEFNKCLALKGVMLSEFLVVYILLLLGIKLNKYGGDLFLGIL